MIGALASAIGAIARRPSNRRSAPSRWRGIAALWAVTMSLSTCAAERISSGAFRNLGAIETQLRRQNSTKADVEKLLSRPDGYGNAALPYTPAPCEMWFYQDIEATDAASRPDGFIEMKVRQQIVLVFFQGRLFDGFMWYSTAIPALGKTP